jgi:hypothetical protein
VQDVNNDLGVGSSPIFKCGFHCIDRCDVFSG